MTPAPVVLFVCDRPAHTARCLEALAQNELASRSELIAFADGARSAATQAAAAAVREAVRSARGFRRCTVVERPANFGLFRSVTEGLAQVAREHDRFIVVEDDLVTAPGFLSYLNDGLQQFAGEARVGSIHGYMYPIAGLPEYFFVNGGDCWGWATWADRWRLFDGDGRRLLRALRDRGLLPAFEAAGGARLTRMLVRRAQGRNQSWAILWHASLVLAGRLTLQPGRSFVRNIGFDDSGTHGGATRKYDASVRRDYGGLPPLEVAPDRAAMARMRRFVEPAGPVAALSWLLARASAQVA